MPSAPHSTIVVRQKCDLEYLSRNTGMTGIPLIEKIVFDLPEFDRSRQLIWERKLNAYYKRCGCVTGSICTLLSLCIAIFYVVRMAEDRSIFSLTLLLLSGLFLSVVLGLLGKVISQLITRAQLKITINQILNATWAT